MLVIPLSFAAAVYAQTPLANFDEILQAFRKYKEIREVAISVPTVVEVPFGSEFFERYDFAVLNQTENKFEPHYFRRDTTVQKIPTTAFTIPAATAPHFMLDDNVNTHTEFLLPEDGPGTVQINLSAQSPITSSALTLLLDQFVALPTSVEIRANVDGAARIVVAKRALERQSIQFPKTTSRLWTITLTYAQPLRITELRLEQENATQVKSQGLRFLAKPNTSYRIYFDPDRRVNTPVGEIGNLASNEGVLLLSPAKSVRNPQ